MDSLNGHNRVEIAPVADVNSHVTVFSCSDNRVFQQHKGGRIRKGGLLCLTLFDSDFQSDYARGRVKIHIGIRFRYLHHPGFDQNRPNANRIVATHRQPA